MSSAETICRISCLWSEKPGIRFFREAKDDFDGYRYYEIIGKFDPSLWEKTDRLIASLEKRHRGGEV